MPEAVNAWVKERDVNLVQQVLLNILNAYERDFSKHTEKREFPKISLIWHSIPSQLARENKKFVYKIIKEGARAREYEDALQWLCDAELAYKIFRNTKPGLPISAYDDLSLFKLYLTDVGLLRRLSLLAPYAFNEGNRLFVEFKGSLSENFVLQSIANSFETPSRYWTDGTIKKEVDFIIQHDNDIYPIEVKSDKNVESYTLKHYGEKYTKQTKLRLRFSMRNLNIDNNVISIPLFMADFLDKIIAIGERDAT